MKISKGARKKIALIIMFAILIGLITFITITTDLSKIPHDSIYINGNSDFISENGIISGSGTADKPYIIENWDIGDSTGIGISVEDTDAYFIIRNCRIHKGGIYFNNVTHGTIDNVICENNWVGIRFNCSSNHTITNSICRSCGDGINLAYSSNNNTISNCRIHSNRYYGIILICSASNNQISNCKVYENSEDGIAFLHSGSNNQIANCSVYKNSWCGIYIRDESNNNTIMYCDVTENSRYGIQIHRGRFDPPSNSNNIHHNNLVGNTHNSYDDSSNSWDDGFEGNYWNDYTGSDANDDGIGDTPYNIPNASNKDKYPLTNPLEISPTVAEERFFIPLFYELIILATLIIVTIGIFAILLIRRHRQVRKHTK